MLQTRKVSGGEVRDEEIAYGPAAADRIPRVPVGPLAPRVLTECMDWLAAQGYSPGSASGIANLLGRLSVWMRDVGAGVDDLGEELLTRFVAAERSREFVCVAVKASMSTMRTFLTAAGYLGMSGAGTGPVTPAQAAVVQWCSWMRDQRGLTEKTIAARCHFAAGFLDVITAADGSLQWGRVDAPAVNAYVAELGRPYSVVTRAHRRCGPLPAAMGARRRPPRPGRDRRDPQTRRDPTRAAPRDRRRTGRGLAGRVRSRHADRGARPGGRLDAGAAGPACRRGRPAGPRRHRLGERACQG